MLTCMYNPDQTVTKLNMPRPLWHPLSAWPLPLVNAGAAADDVVGVVSVWILVGTAILLCSGIDYEQRSTSCCAWLHI